MLDVNQPQSLPDAIRMLSLLDHFEGDKLANRDKLIGVIAFLRRICPLEQ